MRFKISLMTFVALCLLAFFSARYMKAAGAQGANSGTAAARTPVLVELFTSEGCSDCPPADALLAKLDQSQPVRGAQLIVLSEHVDYWNHDGWTDPYSSAQYSERQSSYAHQFGLRTVYTPQMVIDGQYELIGSNESAAIRAIEKASRAEKTPLTLSAVRVHPNSTVVLHLEVGPMPAQEAAKSANILIATADESDESHVKAGENSGRTLRHVAVVRRLVRVGTVDKSGKFARDVTLKLDAENSQNMRLVAFVQDLSTGRILGAESAQASN